MTITKYGHACLLIEHAGARMLIDPGIWNPLPDATHLDAILITHEHQDHCDMAQVKVLTERNPGVRVITHAGVAPLLAAEGIIAEQMEPGIPVDVKGVPVTSCGAEHAAVYKVSPCRNTGFQIGNELYIPGDALHDVPSTPVRVLALPTGGPWMKIEEVIDYAQAVKPEIVFPIHDAMYVESYQRGLIPRVVGGALEPSAIQFVDLPAGMTREF